MSKHFDSVIKKFLTEADAVETAANAAKTAAGSSGTTGAGALETASKILDVEAKKINPNMPKTPVEKLQALVDPANKNVTHVNQIELPNDIKKHLEDIGLLSGEEKKPEANTKQTAQQGTQPNQAASSGQTNQAATYSGIS
jgi:hypothetical protein